MGIKTKLVLSFLLSNTLLASLMVAISSWRFDEGFLAYVTQVEAQRLQPLIDALSSNYGLQQSWQPLLNSQVIWDNLIHEHAIANAGPNRPEARGQPRPPPIGARSPPPRRGNEPGRGQPPPRNTVFFDQRILLANAARNILIGPSGQPKRNTQWLSIESNGAVVGYLGLVPLDFLQGSLDQLFADEQKNTYAWIALGSLAMAVLVGMVLATLWLRPIRLLQSGMQKLVDGDYNQQLQQDGNDELAELAGQFNLLARTLRENKLAQGQWIADISHELRTPVAVLRGEIEALIDGIRPFDEARIESLHEEMLQLQALVSELHELSLSDLGALKYQKSDVDFASFMASLKPQLEKACAEAQLKLTISGDTTSLRVQIDERKFKQMFINLLQNTISYTDQPGALQVSWRVQGKGLEIQWEDSAPGVSDSEKVKLFDRLFRAENSRNRRTGGSGLGLAIVKNIVQAHDGTIEAADSSHGGLQLIIRIPLR